MKIEKYLSWRTSNLRKEDGILVGADITQEWFLPWWWDHFQKHNQLPVAFVDFGLSFPMKEWCQKRGELIPLRIFSDFIKEKEEMDPLIISALEDEFGKHFWEFRTAWFKKPFAFLQSPFERTIWIDIDCEIRGNIRPLFDLVDQKPGIAMAKDLCDSLGHYNRSIYNSGVTAFLHGVSLIIQWAKRCVENNGAFRGDQEVFSQMIADENILLREIPPEYNWSRCHKDQSHAVILHWHGVYGKHAIRTQMNVEELSY